MAIKSLKSGSYGRSVMAGNSIILPGDYESIATTTVGAGGATSISFTNISSTYKHLQLRILTNSTKASSSGEDSIEFTLNNDSGSNYVVHRLGGNGSSAFASAYTSTPAGYFGIQPQTVSGVSYYGAYIIDLLDYANTSKYKTTRTLSGYDANGSGTVNLYSNLWQSTSAISSIQIYSNNRTANFSQYSHFALYGIRG